ncbi:MAG TPA: hypothetical protein VIC03_07255 [Gemmatimonadaceae bacterium]
MVQAMAHQAALTDWGSFYVITGSAAAALTGLQFVVMALVTEIRGQSTESLIDTFSTPTIVHFCAVLLVSAALSAPWQSLRGPAYLLGACGISGAIYALLVARRTRQQLTYKPVMEDWVWHVALPLIAYATLLTAALILMRQETVAMFITSSAVLLLLFVGIHNAWDTVSYIVVERVPEKKGD